MFIRKELDRLAAHYHRTSWEVLRRLGRSPAFSSIVFYPLVAGVVSFNQWGVSIWFIKGWFRPNELLMTRMYFLYFALLFLFLGSAVYALMCPEMIKRYENSLEYAKSELDILTQPVFCNDIWHFISRRLDRHGPHVDRTKKYLSDQLRDALNSVKNEIARGDERINEAAVSAMMLAHWQFMNRAFPFSRIAVFVFYWTGLILMSCVVALSVGEIIYNAIAGNVVGVS